MPEIAEDSPDLIASTPRSHVRLLRLNRPARRNALTNALVGELAASLRAAQRDDGVRVVVVAGDDRSFCAGADIHELRDRGDEAVHDPLRAIDWQAIADFPKPLIAAVEGVALGAGNELCMLADIIVAARGARMGQPEVRIGAIAGDGGTQRLPRRIGGPTAMYHLLTGDPIEASDAHRLGYVTKLCEDGHAVETALEVAEKIASNAPLSVEATKRLVRLAADGDLRSGLEEERKELRQVFASADRHEGMDAFAERRSPSFIGK